MDNTDIEMWIINEFRVNKMMRLDASDLEFMDRFVSETGIDIDHKKWKRRISTAARALALMPKRIYMSQYGNGSGTPRYVMTYNLAG